MDAFGQWKWIVSLCVLGILSTVHMAWSFDVSSCLPPNGPTLDPNEPDQPSLPDLYRVKVEVTVEGRNWTEQADEIVDTPGNRAVLKTLSQGRQTTVIFSYVTQEIFYVIDTNCTVKNLTSDPDQFVFFGESMLDGIGHIGYGATTLFFGPQINKVYIGRAFIRGIWCDQWQACIVWPSPHMNFTINYYFSERGWGTPSTFQQMPVRYDVNGSQLMANGTRRAFHRIYDFFDFMQDADSDTTVFETPEGVVCPGRLSTTKLPQLVSNSYHFKQEIIKPAGGVITQAEVWYDLERKLARLDYRNPQKTPPLDTTDPLSEVHDFRSGVRYVKDELSGQCSPISLYRDTFDAKFNAASYLVNGSYVMSMKNPLTFFFLDSNFTYSGQRQARDALCDVFISHRFDYDIYNNGSALEAKVETFFLAEGWVDIPDDSNQQFSQRFPFRMHLWIPKLSYNLVYNIFDFDTDPVEMAVFDVTDCYDDTSSLHFRVRFTGPYTRDTEHMVKIKGQDALARSLQVSPLRVNRVVVESDRSYLYLSAVLLDRTPSLVQFTHLPHTVTEKMDDGSFSNIANASACSDLCVNNPDINCQSFEFCPADRGACRISRRHIADGAATVVSGTCDLYSRTVNDHPAAPELTVSEAWNNLLGDIQTDALYFEIEEDTQELVRYMGVHAEVTFGKLSNGQAVLPTLTGQFSYRVEVVFPRHKLVNAFDVWYDDVSKLVRYDTRNAIAGPPYYSPFTITTIHDFNAGVAYNIDTQRGNCTVTPLPMNATLDEKAFNWTLVHSSGIEIVTQKSPMEVFFLDDTYTFTGQKTVRGILCDVFESQRTDFKITGSGPQHSVFQFFFQSTDWAYESDSHDDITTHQPVQLIVTDIQANEFLIYNFYNFNDEHTSYDKFNIGPCFTDDQRMDFVLDFNQTYHPYLDADESQFKQEVQLLLASETRMSPLRVQNIEVTYNLDQTYVIATLLGQVAPQIHFAETGTRSLHSTPHKFPQSNEVNCAASCYYNTQIVCNSFDLCPDQACYLSPKHVSDTPVTDASVLCRHFTRTVNGTIPEPVLDDAYTAIEDSVYKGFFIVNIPVGDGSQQTVSYTAIGVRDDLLQHKPPTDTGEVDLQTKFQLYKSGSEMKAANAQPLPGMAVDDCASACLDEEMFTCEAFSYCYTTGNCFLSAKRPATGEPTVVTNPFCDLYARMYLDDYRQYQGQIVESGTQSPLKVSSAEACAQRCSSSPSSPSSSACRSFDFCLTTGDCFLHDVHILQAGVAVPNSAYCSHYSRNYLSDFGKQSHKEVPGHDDVVVSGENAAACAFQCVMARTCRSFEFCGGQCHISSVVPTPATSANSTSCDLYSLMAPAITNTTPRVIPSNKPMTPSATTKSSAATTKAPGHTPAIKPVTPAVITPRPGTADPNTSKHQASTPDPGCNSQQQKSGSPAPNDTGPRVGIAMGVLVLGLLLGAGLVLLVQRVRGQRGDDSALELMPRR